jgi:toxin HigB-1
MRYITIMIRSFANKRTAAAFKGQVIKGIGADLAQRLRIKLIVIDNAADIGDLRSPPGNRLQALSGNRIGQYSIRVNDQWRICFFWRNGDAFEVEFCDYH